MKDATTLLADLAGKAFVQTVEKTELLRTDEGLAWHRALIREIGDNEQTMTRRSIDYYVDEAGKAYYKDQVPKATIQATQVAPAEL